MALALGCAHPKETVSASKKEAIGRYYPLAVGNRWIYETNLLGEKQVRTVEILRQDGGYFVDNEGGQLGVDAFGIRDQKRYLLRDPIEPGREWTNVVSVSSVEHYRIADAGFPCTVPAGTFENCVVVVGKNRVDPRTTLVNELTFAPHVGIVKIETFAEAGDKRVRQVSMVLREFRPAR
jgi:hypothetical protein